MALRDRGVRAIKIRFHHADWRRDLEVVEAVRDAVGSDLELMVDANQGWRMAGDREPRWDVATAAQCAERAGAPRRLLAGGAAADRPTSRATRGCGRAPTSASRRARWCAASTRRATSCCAACLDVIQPDAVLAGGLGGCRRLAALADLCGRMLSPHTWSNGYGLVVNLHLALGVSTCPYVEVPFDPPAWSAERRDWLLPAPVEIAADGTIAPPPGPGLGVTPDLDALEQHRVG